MGWRFGRSADVVGATVPASLHRWAVVDVETSGLYPASHRVLSVAALALDEHGRTEGEVVTLVDGQCDPGPVHIHGLTRERLAGAPAMRDVLPELQSLLAGRVLVAHNASFDYRFLISEAKRAGTELAVSRRLCTLALSRRLGLDVADHRLGTIAAYWGVPQKRTHDAEEDARVLSAVFGHSLRLADELGLELPVVDCDADAVRQPFPARPVKVPCAFVNPGQLPAAGPLVQGMKVAVTGDTRTAREWLWAEMGAAGLDVMSSVSRQTSVVVTNDRTSRSEKVLRAVQHGLPIIDEPTLLALLRDVRPGQSRMPSQPTTPEAEATSGASPPLVPRPAVVVRQSPGPMARRRVLVLGGTHDEAAALRAHVLESGGAAAVNLSANVTDIVVLTGGETDRRLVRAAQAGIRIHLDASELGLPLPVSLQRQASTPSLPRGGVMDLPAGSTWTVNVAWRADALTTGTDLDLLALLVDDQHRVGGDEDVVFFNNPVSENGAVALSIDGASEQSLRIDLSLLEPETTRIVIAAALTGASTFGELGALSVSVDDEQQAPAVTTTLDAGTSENTMLVTEIYRRGGTWRVRAVGQGYDDGLGALLIRYGAEVE